MSVTIISPQEWKKQKWKNGGGITNEVCVKEDEKGILWRLSIADVASDGPFSVFPNIDRIIIMLEGNGFKLKFSDRSQKHIRRKFVPLSFPGESEIQCELIDDSIRDFNLMTRRNAVTAICQVFNLTDYADVKLEPSSKVILYIAEGQVLVTLKREEYLLAKGYTLLFSNENTDMHLSGVGATAFVICLNGEGVNLL